MERIKCITFDKKAQDNLPQHIKDKMKADRDKARKEMNSKGLNIPIVTHSCNICERDIVRTAITYDKVKICHSCLKFIKVQAKLNNRTWEEEVKFQSAYINNCG